MVINFQVSQKSIASQACKRAALFIIIGMTVWERAQVSLVPRPKVMGVLWVRA